VHDLFDINITHSRYKSGKLDAVDAYHRCVELHEQIPENGDIVFLFKVGDW